MKLKKLNKKTVIITSVILLVCAIGCGVWYYLGHSSTDPVYVYPFEYLGMTEYWGDSQESYGPVTTDKIQTIFLSSTQTITEVRVKEGDPVKKGDLLMTFDTTLSDLALERKRLDVEKLKLQAEDAKRELREISAMKPMEPVQPPDDTPSGGGDVDMGSPLRGEYQIFGDAQHDGSSQEKSLICWVGGSTEINSALFEMIREDAQHYQDLNAPEEPTEPVPPETDPVETDPVETDPVDPEPTQTDPVETEPTETDPIETKPEETEPKQTEGETEPEETETQETETQETETQETEEVLSSASSSEGSPDAPPQTARVNDFWVVFKMTQGDMSRGPLQTWQGFHLTKRSDGSYKFTLFDASVVPDFTQREMGGSMPEMPDIDFGSGFTAAQLAQMRAEQERKLRDLDFQIKMADAEYRIMQTEVSDGNIYAEIDGTVVSILPEEEAKLSQQPVMKVSGGGGFYIEGSVNELDKDNLTIGQEVTVNNWRGGTTYTGTVHSIGDFPADSSYWSSNINPNASYYPFKVFVDESADLQAGDYVSVMYSAGTSENGIYLENPFLRTEKGRSYVMVQGKDGRLEQRFVTTGKSLWGSYTEILDGLTPEDLIAFPYGKNVKPGVAVQEGDRSNLYG